MSSVFSVGGTVKGLIGTRVVANSSGTASATVPAGPISPAFFVFDGVHATATHSNGSLLGPTDLYPGLSTPAKPNEVVMLYANGLGTTSQPVMCGAISQGGVLPALPVIKIGGIPAAVQFAGLVSPGLFQLNVVVPNSVPDGDNALTGTYNDIAMQSGVTIAVQR